MIFEGEAWCELLEQIQLDLESGEAKDEREFAVMYTYLIEEAAGGYFILDDDGNIIAE